MVGMSPLPYFDNLSRMLELFDDELLEELITRTSFELQRRAKFTAASELRDVVSSLVIDRKRLELPPATDSPA